MRSRTAVYNLAEASRVIGKDKSYFSVLKHFQSYAFEEMYRLGDGNLVVGYNKYNDTIDNAKAYLEEWFYGDDKMMLFKVASRYSNSKSEESKIICARQLIDTILFKSKINKVQHRLYLKMNDIVSSLKELKDGS